MAGTAAGDGGATSLGTLCIANGGRAGQANTFLNPNVGNPGGAGLAQTSPPAGTLSLPGNIGEPGWGFVATGVEVLWGGSGAPPALGGYGGGGGGFLNGGSSPGGAGSMGGGGSGGFMNNVTTTVNGGAGGSGWCLVTEYS